MKRIGLVGWRGMVGSVLMQRMQAEKDFAHIEPHFFSTSQAGGRGPNIGKDAPPVKDAKSIDALKGMEIIVTCQGGDYTNEVYPQLRAAGWKGYWIDAASALRMKDDAVIILDPVNLHVIQDALAKGVKNYIGGNCTVSLMLMGLARPVPARAGRVDDQHDLSGGQRRGAQNMRELVKQMGHTPALPRAAGRSGLGDSRNRPPRAETHPPWGVPRRELRRAARRQPDPLDRQGPRQRPEQGRMERPGRDEQDPGPRASRPIPVDGVCVRVGAMRCHSQALTIKLTKDVPLAEIEGLLAAANDWVKVVPNEKDARSAS